MLFPVFILQGSNVLLWIVPELVFHSSGWCFNIPLLIKTSDATWQAYNYGGNTYYATATPVPGFTHATKSELSAPDTCSFKLFKFLELWISYGYVAWKNGYHVSYTTDWDMARTSTPITPANHKVIMSSGHDEYWSAEERNRIESARNSGVHLAFFSGNTAYWNQVGR